MLGICSLVNKISNNIPFLGFYDHQAALRDNQRCSVAKAYLVPAENRTNLDILPNARARKVILLYRLTCIHCLLRTHFYMSSGKAEYYLYA